MSKPVDYQAREAALDPTRSFAVSAPAGSGKTELLTQRVLKLLPRCQQPEEVVCITFTRKAAGEMRARITDALMAAVNTPEPEDDHKRSTWLLAKAVLEHDKESDWGLLLNPSRLRITTIDGFCRSLVQQMPFESGLGGVAETLDQPYIAYQLAVRNFFRHLESDNNEVSEAMSVLFSHLDNNLGRIEGLLCNLLACRDQWLAKIYVARSGDARAFLSNTLRKVTEDSLQQLSQSLLPVASDLASVLDYAGTNLSESGQDSPIALCGGLGGLPEPVAESLPQWLGLAELLLTGKGEWRKSVTVKNGFPAGTGKAEKEEAKSRKGSFKAVMNQLRDIPGAEADIRAVRFLPTPDYADKDWALVGALTTVLPILAAELQLVFRELSATDFTEVTLGALNALGQVDEYSELTLKMDYAISHLLMDEFQDTATPQLHLLQSLTEGWAPGDGRTLFVVGDGMQSIYGFRDANVGIFLGVRQGNLDNIDVTPLDLTVNFRSQAGVVNWVNDNFKDAFPETANIGRGAVPYSPSHAFKEELPETAVQCHALIDAPDRKAEARKVVNLIEQARLQKPDESIAILVRTRPQLKEILESMREQGLRWQATEIAPLSSRQSIVDLMTITRVLLSATDRIAWLSFLRAPWAGLNLNDLYHLANSAIDESATLSDGYPVLLTQLQHFAEIQKITLEGRQILERIVPILLQAWDGRRRKSLRIAVEGLWLSLGGPAALAVQSELEDTKTYFDLLERNEEAGTLLDWSRFESAVEQLYAAPHPDADPNLVVMTAHRSKGLEFDRVIMPGLDKGSRSDDKQLMLWQEWLASDGSEHLMMATLGETGGVDAPAYRFLNEERRIKTQLEATRLLYVGATRAINHLHLLANVAVDPKKEDFKKPGSGSLLSCIWPSFVEQMETADCANENPVTDSDVDETPALGAYLRLSEDWKAPILKPSAILDKYRGIEIKRDLNTGAGEGLEGEEDNIPTAESYHARDARIVGIVIHRLLCRVGRSGVKNWNDEKIDAMASSVSAQLLQEGLGLSRVKAAVERVLMALKRTLADSKGRWLLDNSHTDSGFEVPFNTWKQTDVSSHIIDRTFVDGDGTRWIVDYKSSEPGDLAVDDFLRHEAQAYESQLVRYRGLYESMGEGNIQCALYFPLLSVFHVLD